MPGRFPFRSSSPANPEIIPRSINVSEALPQSLSEEQRARALQQAEALRSPTMAQFFEDVERLRSNFRGLAEDMAFFRPVLSWTGILLLFTVLYGTGINAMFGKQYVIAIGLVFAAFSILGIKGISETKNWRQSVLIFVVCLLMILLHLLWIMRSTSP